MLNYFNFCIQNLFVFRLNCWSLDVMVVMQPEVRTSVITSIIITMKLIVIEAHNIIINAQNIA